MRAYRWHDGDSTGVCEIDERKSEKDDCEDDDSVGCRSVKSRVGGYGEANDNESCTSHE